MLISSWTDDRVAELTKLHAEGYSSAQIATKLEGTTRNAVLGKIFRIGLSPPIVKRYQPTAPKAPRKAKSVQRIAASRRYEAISNPEPIALRCVEIAGTVPISDVTGCRYIAGDDYLFCDGPQKAESSYCVAHHALVWIPAATKPPKARMYHGTDFARRGAA